jgi:hypothetical protein
MNSVAIAEHLADMENNSFTTAVPIFAPGEMLYLVMTSAFEGTRVQGPFIVLSKAGTNTYRCLVPSYDNPPAKIMIYPQNRLKRWKPSPLQEICHPPRNPFIDENRDAQIGNFILVRREDSYVLFVVVDKDDDAETFLCVAYASDRLGRFVKTNQSTNIKKELIVGIVKLTRERRLPTPLIEHVSRGGYVV